MARPWLEVQSFAIVRGGGSVPGATWFVRQWLGLPEGAQLVGDYERGLLGDTPVVAGLIAAPLPEPQRFGAFTEPAWLAAHPTISARGNAALAAILQPAPPSPPR